MSNRQPLPALSLVMPHPQLPATLTRIYSPRTPRACTPSTPHLFSKQLIASPRTSIDSWGSSSGAPDDDVQWEWKSEQVSLLHRTLDSLPGHLYTPFNGSVPPSNLLDKIARSVSQAQGPLEWPHSVRATRAKLVEIARTQGKENMSMNMIIDEADEEEQLVSGTQVLQQQQSQRTMARKRPLYRQSSMDFLPSKDKASGNLSRLSSRLQRTDRIIPSYHPYARPASRSPSPPSCVDQTHRADDNYPPISIQPQIRHFPTLRPRPRSRTSLTTSLTAPAPVLRRTTSVSNPLDAENTGKPPIPLRRVGSCSIAAQPGPLKRAPSFGSIRSVNMDKPDTGSTLVTVENTVGDSKTAVIPVEKIQQDLETDDEEKSRQVKAKRPRTKSKSGTAAGTSEKKKRDGDSQKETEKYKVEDGKSVGKTSSSSKVKPMSPGVTKPVKRSAGKPSSSSSNKCSSPASASGASASTTSDSSLAPSSSTHSRTSSRSKSSAPNPKSPVSSSSSGSVALSSPSKPKSKPKAKSSSSSATNPTASSTAKQTSKVDLSSRPGSNLLFGAELPHLGTKATLYNNAPSEPFVLCAPFATDDFPLADTSTIATSATSSSSGSPPKTLRRVKTTAFPSSVMGMGVARRISFGSLVDPEAGKKGEASGNGLEDGWKGEGPVKEGEGLLGAVEIV